MILLRGGDWEAQLLPQTGGAFGTLRHRGQDVLRPTPAGATDPLQTACFPLAPYCNRIRDGRFRFAGRTVVMPPYRPPPPHSLHGLSWQRPWRVEASDEDACVLADEYDGAGPWPWAFRAEQRLALGPEGCAIALVLTNRSGEPMPAGLGLHPYFRRRPESRVRFEARQMLLAGPDLLPTGIAPADHLADWPGGTCLPGVLVDHCFTGWGGEAWITDDLGTIRLTAGGAPHLHLYAPREGTQLCLEPVSHTPDAPNRAPEEMIILPPGCSATISMHISVTP